MVVLISYLFWRLELIDVAVWLGLAWLGLVWLGLDQKEKGVSTHIHPRSIKKFQI